MIHAILSRAAQDYQSGDLTRAESRCREILSAIPEQPDALNILGLIAFRAGRYEVACQLLNRAIAVSPHTADYHSNLGMVLATSQKIDEATRSLNEALRLNPNHADARLSLGNVFALQENFSAAVIEFLHAIKLQPGMFIAADNLGKAFFKLGRYDQAVEAFDRVTKLQPGYTEAFVNLAQSFLHLGRSDDAIAALERGISKNPRSPQLYHLLGNILKNNSQFNEAIRCYRTAIQCRPDFAESYINLGGVLRMKGQLREAATMLKEAVRLKPDSAEAYNNLGNVLRELSDLDGAAVAFQEALRIDSSIADTHNNLGVLQKDQGLLDDAIQSFRQALRHRAEMEDAHSNLLYAMHFHCGYDSEDIYHEHEQYRQRHAARYERENRPHQNNADPDRKLRVGYVSPDLRDHAVARFFLPLIRNHDRQQYQIICYSDAIQIDGMTQQIRACSNEWRETAKMTDEELARQIRADKIDVLVDLSLHMAQNRMLVFARQPAPAQITWLGYAGTSGLKAMQYRMTDWHLDPPGVNDQFYSEKSIRLPESYWCYDPPMADVEVKSLPVLLNGHITFGCLNNFCKVSDPAVETWCGILSAVPNSRIIIHSHRGTHQNRVRGFLAARGVDPQRLRFVGHQPLAAYLETYNSIDIALDPFPYNGGTTTADALWMGVPVVGLVGERAVSRAAASLLNNVGHPELLAQSHEQYIEIATGLAGDLTRLVHLRQTLRGRMLQSRLMDATRFSKNIEAAYRNVWRDWCTTSGASSSHVAAPIR